MAKNALEHEGPSQGPSQLEESTTQKPPVDSDNLTESGVRTIATAAKADVSGEAEDQAPPTLRSPIIQKQITSNSGQDKINIPIELASSVPDTIIKRLRAALNRTCHDIPLIMADQLEELVEALVYGDQQKIDKALQEIIADWRLRIKKISTSAIANLLNPKATLRRKKA